LRESEGTLNPPFVSLSTPFFLGSDAQILALSERGVGDVGHRTARLIGHIPTRFPPYFGCRDPPEPALPDLSNKKVPKDFSIEGIDVKKRVKRSQKPGKI